MLITRKESNVTNKKSKDLLYEVKNSHSVSDRGKEMGAIGTEEQVALAVHRA